jgi:hypothetical protein
MDHAALVTFWHIFLVSGAVVTLILVGMAFYAFGTSTDSYDDDTAGGAGGH